MVEKKNQHFVPRLYLRKFSLHPQNRKSSAEKIGVFNISSSKFIKSANLYDQASKSYFYGRDLRIENALGNLENESAKIINLIIKKNTLPLENSVEHQMLLLFIVSLLGRTLSAAESIDELVEKYRDNIASIDENFLSQAERNLDLSLTDAVQKSLDIFVAYFPIIRDLHWRLIINETDEPFITSDHPVVLYNQFLETRKRYGSNVGLAAKGLEIFLPLSPNHTLFLFDGDVYKARTKNKYCVTTQSSKDVRFLNLLQCINANRNLYFNDKVPEKKIRDLLKTALRFKHQAKINIKNYLDESNHERNKMLIHLYTSDIKCSLKISFVSILKKARSYNLDQEFPHVRNREISCLHEKFIELVIDGTYKSSDFYKFLSDRKNFLSPHTPDP